MEKKVGLLCGCGTKSPEGLPFQIEILRGKRLIDGSLTKEAEAETRVTSPGRPAAPAAFEETLKNFRVCILYLVSFTFRRKGDQSETQGTYLSLTRPYLARSSLN